TAIRDKILASLARYRALRIGKFPCAFWRLSSRPGLTAHVIYDDIKNMERRGEKKAIREKYSDEVIKLHMFGYVLDIDYEELEQEELLG
ncbi:hypothetical protein, partial [Bathymodiolus platifrons methanotrophic gill symbiont]